ncbi:MAG: hypothetical protein K0Q65_1059 [Clostridia bacterium]|nr:hypothetical protein [Clostridia bacterium]
MESAIIDILNKNNIKHTFSTFKKKDEEYFSVSFDVECSNNRKVNMIMWGKAKKVNPYLCFTAPNVMTIESKYREKIKNEVLDFNASYVFSGFGVKKGKNSVSFSNVVHLVYDESGQAYELRNLNGYITLFTTVIRTFIDRINKISGNENEEVV